MIPKDQEGQPKRPGGTFWRRGTLSRGSPQDAVLQKRTNKTRASEKKRRNASTRWRGFSLWVIWRCVMPQFLRNCGRGNRGRPAGHLSLFWGCARGATSRISLSAESEEGAALHPASLLKKAGPKTCFVLTFAVNYCQKSKNFRIQTKLSPIPPHICHILSGKRTIFSRRNVIE